MYAFLADAEELGAQFFMSSCSHWRKGNKDGEISNTSPQIVYLENT